MVKKVVTYKRRVGRPRKPGPKKKRVRKKKVFKKRGRKALSPISYKIVSCKNGKQNKLIGKYRTSEDAYEKFNSLKELDKNVVFPMSVTGDETLENSIDEYVLIERSDKKSTSLRNEYGKLVEHYTNKEGWVIIDKFRYKKEETFWVYGYEKKSERKTFSWIYQNMIVENQCSIIGVNFVMIYKNKLLIRYDNDDFGLIICKTDTDCIKLYNLLESKVKKDKIKNFVFIGNYSRISKQRKKIEKYIMDITGWPLKKVQMKYTTYYLSKNK